MATWKRITSEAAYKKAIQRINALIDAKRTEAVQNELSLLAFLVEEYEVAAYPLPDADPTEVIRYMMDLKGLKQHDLIPILGTKGNVSKILGGKANLQLSDIYPLSTLLGIPAEALIPKTDSSYSEAVMPRDHSAAGRIAVQEDDVPYISKKQASGPPKKMVSIPPISRKRSK